MAREAPAALFRPLVACFDAEGLLGEVPKSLSVVRLLREELTDAILYD